MNPVGKKAWKIIIKIKMKPIYHFIIGILSSVVLFILFKEIGITELFIIFSASFFIDVDHYLYYVFKKKDLSLKNAYNWYLERKEELVRPRKNKVEYKRIIYIFHGVEFLLLLLIISLFYPIFFWVILGMAIHMFSDVLYYYKGEIPYFKISQIYVYIKNRNKKEFNF